ncbi:MAG: hypothetical protein K2V38_23220, partial [Gemmataceae bacterium]|nr:hypothetical protein [Gemmataceae bacterium]
MSQLAPAPARSRLEAGLLAAAFALAHTQSPLPYSNQNQYLLHGAALAGHGHLANDWLAATADPTPLFSLLVAGAYSADPWLLQPAYFLLLMAYFLGVRGVVSALPWFPNTRAARVGFAALFTAAHAAILRWLSVQGVGVDYPWYFQAGLAAQYLLGPGIQPSAFGVLLVWAIACFAGGRPACACALAAGACWFHSTYLLPAGLLAGGFVVAGLRSRPARGAAWPVLASVLLFLPPVVHAASFQQGDTEEAYRILADVRIPHHCHPARWFDLVAGLQVAWIGLGIWLLRRAPLGIALGLAAAGGAILTGAQVLTGSKLLALAFPWRISVLLVPLA